MGDEQPTYYQSDADANDGVGLAEAISAVERVIEALAPFDISTSHIEQTLLQLRSWQDPWHEAKQALKVHLDSGGYRVKAVAQYARYLEQELANCKPSTDPRRNSYEPHNQSQQTEFPRRPA